MGARIDLTGRRFGRLTVLEDVGRRRGGVLWRCKCDCGNVVDVMGQSLRDGRTLSCGCYNKEVITKHNMSRSRLYGTWVSMIGRCTKESSPEYERYGGRGITVCDEWLNDREAFFEWAMANGYKEGMKWKYTIDRIDNSKGYSPDNCRWVDMKVQGRNRRNNVVLEYNGEKHCLSEWAEILHENYAKLVSRHRRNWPVREILYGRQ